MSELAEDQHRVYEIIDSDVQVRSLVFFFFFFCKTTKLEGQHIFRDQPNNRYKIEQALLIECKIPKRYLFPYLLTLFKAPQKFNENEFQSC